MNDEHGVTVESPPERKPGTGWKEEYLGGSPEAEAELQGFQEVVNNIQFDAAGTANVVPRCFHAKTHLGIKGTFTVNPDIHPDLRVGFYREPGAQFDADVRFSNGSVNKRPDIFPDVRGISVRVYHGQGRDQPLLSGATGGLQDYLCVNTHAAFAAYAYGFVGLMHAFHTKHRHDLIERIFVSPVKKIPPVGWPLLLPDYVRMPDFIRRVRRFVRFLRAAQPPPENAFKEGMAIVRRLQKQVSRPPDSLAGVTFWSQAPLKWGELAVEFKFAPHGYEGGKRGSGDDYLSDDIRARVKRGPLKFDFMIQRFANEERTPIENAAVEWDTEYEKVAELEIPQTPTVDDEEGRRVQEEIDAIRFSPYNTTDDFRPLGSLNRSRLAVYKHSQAVRDTHCPMGYE